MNKLIQPFHLVTLSPWPILLSLSILNLMISLIYWLSFNVKLIMVFLFLFMVILCLFQWWRDVIRESLLQGFHSLMVVKGLKMGMLLFILSEIFFFISVFWCYFHMFLSPSIEIGSLWPPKNIQMFNPYMIPLLNTMILVCSGVSITWCHYSIINMNKLESLISLFITLILGMIFSFFQYKEYMECTFTFSDSVYGSIFFMSTGFHGFHVLIGSLFILVNLVRLNFNNFSNFHHLGFEMAAWYWHFVDVVWLFLYLLVYFWSY
uniref:cytochrome c oxidase subunit III n=1 Tax=Leptomastidea bifasciata TaxID=1880993 RepID=UPI002E76AAA9|nr:cytochrome c oxidase subunit III [Leptomastidea bifasciata]WPT46955.1 cytochrome c oxidase subunit III [Leptomastidea bifasciata]